VKSTMERSNGDRLAAQRKPRLKGWLPKREDLDGN
jgi:hypothetical protein